MRRVSQGRRSDWGRAGLSGQGSRGHGRGQIGEAANAAADMIDTGVTSVSFDDEPHVVSVATACKQLMVDFVPDRLLCQR